MDSVWATLIKNGFAMADLRLSTLILALRDEKKDYFIALTKKTGIIKEFVDKNLYTLLNSKIA